MVLYLARQDSAEPSAAGNECMETVARMTTKNVPQYELT